MKLAPDAAAWSVQPTQVCAVGPGASGGLQGWIVRHTVTPQAGGRLTVTLHNANDACGGASAPLPLRGQLSLAITPLADPKGKPLARITLPPPPAQLPPATDADLDVRLSGGLAPGWYVATPTDQVPGGSPTGLTPLGWFPTMDDFIVAGPGRPAGSVTRAVGPAPVVGGLTMPLIKVAWSSDDLADFEIHAPVVCGPGTDRAMHIVGAPGAISATASGPDFGTALPPAGGGGNPAQAENSFQFGPFPGNTTLLTLHIKVLINACRGSAQGPEIASGDAVWQVKLP